MSFKTSYTISCTVHSEILDDDIVYNDIHSFRIIKSPFSKTASITTITIEADQETLLILENEIKTNQFPKMVVFIFDSAKKKVSPEKKLTKSDLIKKSTYQIIGCGEENRDLRGGNEEFERGRRVYTFLLANPIVFWLSNNHGFNTIQSGLSYDALLSFEQYLKNTFGDMFDFLKYTEQSDITRHGHEMLLTRADMDINVPKELLIKYKALKSLSYYFIDDFHVGDSIHKKQVVCQLFSFGSTIHMPKVDLNVAEFADVKYNIQITDSQPVLDYHLDFQAQSTTAFVETPSGKSEIAIPKTVDNTALKNLPGRTTEYNVDMDRKVANSKDIITDGLGIPNSHITLYSPDTAQLAVERFNNTKFLVTQQLRAYVEINLDSVDMDVFDLNKLYNLSERAQFNFTPTIIEYDFNHKGARNTSKELMCSVRARFVEFELNPILTP